MHVVPTWCCCIRQLSVSIWNCQQLHYCIMLTYFHCIKYFIFYSFLVFRVQGSHMDPYMVNMEAALLSDKAFSQNWAKGANVLSWWICYSPDSCFITVQGTCSCQFFWILGGPYIYAIKSVSFVDMPSIN